ncbi:hypothetical protein P0M11_11190 [Kaistella sp. PBT33-4]|uniref:hypothetical protein n=1 Tax=Kaistella sp. PBT33-4 TaxID=3032000 RepID=UPI0023D7EA6F|nr:hypothetical protein [Kaistella sp. PBT33-4]MDF0720562.1 hypothetical protein [Kaistella sp. PBT33-4]
MNSRTHIIFLFLLFFLPIGATEIWNFPKTGFKQIHPTSRQVIESKLLANATFQKKFLDDFGALGNDEFLAMMELMAKNNGAAVDNWLLMLQNTIEEERKLLAYLESSTLSNSLIRYYDEDNLKSVLEKLTADRRQKILEEVGNNISYFNRFKQDSDLLEGWIRYRYEPNFKAAFSNLSANEVELFRFLQKYGDIPNDAFNNLKLPYENVTVENKFKQLLDFPDATHDIAYFNKRRAEMLPPDFADIATKNIYRVHEVDSIIQLELQFGGVAKASLSHQAGDVIMLGGSLHGKSLDPMGIPQSAVNAWQGNYAIQLERFEKAIDKHFKKIHTPDPGKPSLDKVVIDFNNMDQINPNLKQHVLDYIQINHQQYDNSNYLIKLNF